MTVGQHTFYLVPPGKMSSSDKGTRKRDLVVCAHWWVKYVKDPECANMQEHILRKDGVDMPCLTNNKRIAEFECLAVAEGVDEPAEDEVGASQSAGSGAKRGRGKAAPPPAKRTKR